jgi:hypothetical protein
MTIVLGWWAIPLLITILAFAWAWIDANPYTLLFVNGLAAIISLSSWLIWSLLCH